MAVVVLIVAACAVVAVGATGVGFLRPAAPLDDAWVRGIRIGGAAAALAGLVALLVQRRRLRADGDRGRDVTVAALLAAATLMGLLTLVALFAPRMAVQGGSDPGALVATEGRTINPEAPPTVPPPPPSGTAPVTEGAGVGEDREEPDWRVRERAGGEGADREDDGLRGSLLQRWGVILLLVLLSAVVVITALALWGRRGHRRQEPPPERQPPGGQPEPGPPASAGDVAYEDGDPRRSVTVAYHRLMAALAAAGAPRQPQEAPHEHLRRALGSLGGHREPMRRLTELYVVAQFSERPLTEEHGAEAVQALEASLASLGGTNGSPGPNGPGPAPGEGGA